MLNRSTRYLLAALQLLIAWEWVVSSLDKLLAGTFPQSLASILSDGIKGNPNGWYVSFLQLIILPNSVFIGYLVEWLELAIGIAFIVGAFLLLKRQKMQGEAGHKSLVGLYTAVVIAALLCVVLCINFHFWAGRGIIPGLHGDPGDEGVDLDALIPPLSLIVAFANYALILQLRGHAWFSKQRIA